MQNKIEESQFAPFCVWTSDCGAYSLCYCILVQSCIQKTNSTPCVIVRVHNFINRFSSMFFNFDTDVVFTTIRTVV